MYWKLLERIWHQSNSPAIIRRYETCSWQISICGSRCKPITQTSYTTRYDVFITNRLRYNVVKLVRKMFVCLCVCLQIWQIQICILRIFMECPYCMFVNIFYGFVLFKIVHTMHIVHGVPSTLIPLLPPLCILIVFAYVIIKQVLCSRKFKYYKVNSYCFVR